MANTFGGYTNKAAEAQQRTMYAKEQQTRLDSILQTTKASLKVWDEIAPKLVFPEKPTPVEPKWDPKPVRQEKEYKPENYSVEKPNEKQFFSHSRQAEIHLNILKIIGVIVLVTVVVIIGANS